MWKPIKILTAVFGGLAGLVALSIGGIYLASEARINKTYVVQPAPIDIPSDAASIAEGQRLFTVRGCVDCRTRDLGGNRFIRTRRARRHQMAQDLRKFDFQGQAR